VPRTTAARALVVMRSASLPPPSSAKSARCSVEARAGAPAVPLVSCARGAAFHRRFRRCSRGGPHLRLLLVFIPPAMAFSELYEFLEVALSVARPKRDCSIPIRRSFGLAIVSSSPFTTLHSCKIALPTSTKRSPAPVGTTGERRSNNWTPNSASSFAMLIDMVDWVTAARSAPFGNRLSRRSR
jgi:hypothetical protein